MILVTDNTSTEVAGILVSHILEHTGDMVLRVTYVNDTSSPHLYPFYGFVSLSFRSYLFC
jgi:hypothetical protein